MVTGDVVNKTYSGKPSCLLSMGVLLEVHFNEIEVFPEGVTRRYGGSHILPKHFCPHPCGGVRHVFDT
jgi:hypothetical protein